MTLQELIAALTGGERRTDAPYIRERDTSPMPQAPARYPGQAGALRPTELPASVMQLREPLAVPPRASARPAPPPVLPPRTVQPGALLSDFEAQRRGALEYGMDSLTQGGGWPREMPRFAPGEVKLGPQEPVELDRPTTVDARESAIPFGALQQNRMRDAADFAGYINTERTTGRLVDPIAVAERLAPPRPPEEGLRRDWMRATEGALPNEDGSPAETELPFMEQWQLAEARRRAREAMIRARRGYGPLARPVPNYGDD